MPRSKIFGSFAEAVADIPNGSTIGSGEARRKGAHLRLEWDARRFDDAVGCADAGMADPQQSGEESHLLLHGADPRLAEARLQRVLREGADRGGARAAGHLGRTH